MSKRVEAKATCGWASKYSDVISSGKQKLKMFVIKRKKLRFVYKFEKYWCTIHKQITWFKIKVYLHKQKNEWKINTRYEVIDFSNHSICSIIPCSDLL